jgi:ketosteroid isomerase-like protein
MMSEEDKRNLELAARYIETIGNPSSTIEDLKPFFDESIVWREMPNRFAPEGRTNDYAGMQASFEKGRQFVTEQVYTLRSAVASGDTVALEIGWRAKMAKALPPFAAGDKLSAELASFIRLRDGKIVSQTDYPCYGPVVNSAGG